MDVPTYLEDDVTGASLTVAQLRSALVDCGVSYASNALKPALVALFNDEIASRRAELREKLFGAPDKDTAGKISLVPSKRGSEDDDSEFVDHSMASLGSVASIENDPPRKRRQKRSKRGTKTPEVVTPPPGSYLNLEKLEMDENDSILNLTIDQVQTPLKAKVAPIDGPTTVEISSDEEVEVVVERDEKEAAELSFSDNEEILREDISTNGFEVDELLETPLEEIAKDILAEMVEAEVPLATVETPSETQPVENPAEHVSENAQHEIAVEAEAQDLKEVEEVPAEAEDDVEIEVDIEKIASCEAPAPRATSRFARLVKYLTISLLLSSLGLAATGGAKLAQMKSLEGYCATSHSSPANNPSFHPFNAPRMTDSLPDTLYGLDITRVNELAAKGESSFWKMVSPHLACEPCPPNARCSLDGSLACEPGFLKSQALAHYLSFGTLPETLTASCEVDTITPLRYEFIREYSHNLLRAKPDGLMTVGELHDLLKASRGPEIDDAQFEDFWANYLRTELKLESPDAAASSKLDIVNLPLLENLEKITHVTPTHFQNHKLPTGAERRKRRSIFNSNA